MAADETAAVARMPPQEAPRPLNGVLTHLPDTIFGVMSSLAKQHQSVNLGQGFPDDEGPDSMKALASQEVAGGWNQYTDGRGLPAVRQAVARHSSDFAGLPVDWQTQVLLTAGATEGLAAALVALVNPGDEVILFDPMYDSYAPIARRAGATVVPVSLDPSDWSIPRAALAAAFSDRTKLVLVNTPHNPTGKVFARSDLDFIAALILKHNAYAVLDEVYEHLVYPGTAHMSLRALPGMAERALRIGSAGKTFSFTGWKVGWVTGPAPLVAAAFKAHQFLTYCLPGPLQTAVGHGLDCERGFFQSLGPTLHKKREFLAAQLASIGFRVLPAQGTYFLIADFRPLLPEGRSETDDEFAIRLTKEAGVTVIPVSAFYFGEQRPRHLVRFCFCKKDATLQAACERLRAYFGR